MNWLRAISPLIFIVLYIASCQQPTRQDKQAGAAEEVNSREAAASGYRQLAVDSDRTIPVYETFEQLASLFEQSGDTTYVINFWATWCKPCVEELPFFTRLYNDYKGRKVRVILLSLDFKRDLEDQLVPFVRERQLKPEVMVLLDGNYNDWIDRVDPSWGGAIPATLVYNGRGHRFHAEQFASYEQLEELLASLL